MTATATATANRSSVGSTQAFCLIAQTSASGGPGGGRVGQRADGHSSAPRPLIVGEGVSYLVIQPGLPPQVQVRKPVSAEGQDVFVLEAVRKNQQLRLLFVSPRSDRVLLNAAPAPRVALLTERDQLIVDDGRLVLHVSMWVRPYVGPPTGETLGRLCSLCRIKIEDGTRLYVCPWCLDPLHLETGSDGDGDNALQCAAITTICPSCHHAVISTEGLTYVPQEINGA